MNLRQLKKMNVETVSGVKLGRVCDVVFETDGQSVLQYEVSKCCLLGKKHLVNRVQIVRFEEKKMVVEDTVSHVEAKSEKISVEPFRQAQGKPAMMDAVRKVQSLRLICRQA